MKVATRLVLDFATGEELEKDSFCYSGPVAQCGGSSPTFGKASPPSVPEVPPAEPVPTAEETKDPLSKAVRDAEANRLKARRGLAGTILTSPLGTTGQSGSNLLGA